MCYRLAYELRLETGDRLLSSSILTEHATVTHKGNSIIILAHPDAKLMVNGKAARDETEIHHNDRYSCISLNGALSRRFFLFSGPNCAKNHYLFSEKISHFSANFNPFLSMPSAATEVSKLY